MDDFDNFFNNEPEHDQRRTPIYHTPYGGGGGGYTDPPPQKPKMTTASKVMIIVSAFLCIILIANVVVLVSLKDTISEKYAEKLAATMRDEYAKAIADTLSGEQIIDDITDSASEWVINNLGLSVSELAAKYCYDGTAVITCTNSVGTYTGTGFLVSDRDTASGITTRYLVTNAHVVMYEKETRSQSHFGYGSTVSYDFALFDTIKCNFANDSTTYTLKVLAVGSYKGDNVLNADYNTKPDLAVCYFQGSQPDETQHPSLKIASSDYTEIGTEVAIIGNPASYGLSITTGCVSNPAREISNWGAGKFIMTDAAINGGNSGGPMVNRNCTVVGVVESKIVDESIDNMGFAVSAGTLADFLIWAQQSANNQLKTNVSIPYTLVNYADSEAA